MVADFAFLGATAFVEDEALEAAVRPLCEDEGEWEWFLEACDELMEDILEDEEAELEEDECLYATFSDEDGLNVYRTTDFMDEEAEAGCAIMLIAAHIDDIEYHQLEPGRWYEPDDYLAVRDGEPTRLTPDELNDLFAEAGEELNFDEDGTWLDDYQEDDDEDEQDEEPRRTVRGRKVKQQPSIKPEPANLDGFEKLWNEKWKGCYVTKKIDPDKEKTFYHVEGGRDDIFAWKTYVMEVYPPFKFNWKTIYWGVKDEHGVLILDIERKISVEEKAQAKQMSRNTSRRETLGVRAG